tara:strand:- start:547 stop:1224 length:678 start_codon:yes stop_codon:yes gene_type:complete
MFFENAIIMAAGRGLRMKPLTDKIPKAMAPINSSTLIADRIKKLKEYFKFVHITVGYKGSILAKHVIEHDVSSVINTEGKGNSWWVFNTLLKNINGPLFVFTCDNLVDLDYEKYIEDYKIYNSPACMVIPVKPIEGIKGDYIFHKDNCVTSIERNKSSKIYCSGVQIINTYKINSLIKPKDNFLELWKELINFNELYVSKHLASNWYSIDDIYHLDKVNNKFENH